MKKEDYIKALIEFDKLEQVSLAQFCRDKNMNYDNTRKAFNQIKRNFSNITLKCRKEDQKGVLALVDQIGKFYPNLNIVVNY